MADASEQELELVQSLARQHDAEIEELRRLNRYYEGTQPLTYMHPEVQAELGDRIKPVVIAWPQLVVDAVEERMDVEGFRLPDADAGDDDLWRVWQSNDMDEQSQMGHVDSLVMKRSYVTVGTNENDKTTPLLTAESPLEMFASFDPRRRKYNAGLKRSETESTYARSRELFATLYQANSTIWFEMRGGAWAVLGRDDHDLGEPPFVAVVNRGRLHRQHLGFSELSPVIPLSDSANKVATDMMLGAEFLGLPIHGFFGIGPEDLEDAEGNPLTAMQMRMRRLLTLPTGSDEGAKEFTFQGANLSGFHESLNKLAQTVASLAGLPPHYLGFTTDNPASADAIRSAESRLVKRCERKQRPWGGAYEQMCRIVRRFQTDEWDPKLKRLETIWRDPSTPTVAQKADAAVKLYTAPPGQKPIATLRQTREDVGYTDAQIRKMEREDEVEEKRKAELDPLRSITRDFTDAVPTSAMNGNRS